MSEQPGGNKAITERLTAEFPKDALKHRQGGGRNGLAYYKGDTIIRRLIAATDNQFDVEVTDYRMSDTLIIARVRLTIPGLGSREHIGVQRWAETTKSGAQAGEDLIKGCVTDALKKAATLFGVALDLYGEDYEAEPHQTAQNTQRQAEPTPLEQTTPEQKEIGKRRLAEVEALISESDWDMPRAVKFLRSIGMTRWSTVTDDLINRLAVEVYDEPSTDSGKPTSSPTASPEAHSPDDWLARINRITDGTQLSKLSVQVLKGIKDGSIDPSVQDRIRERFTEINGTAA